MRYRYQSLGQVYSINLERQGAVYRAAIDNISYEVEVLDAQPGEISLRFDGRPVTLYWAADGSNKWLSLDGCTYYIQKPSPRLASQPGEGAGEAIIRSPMPAQVQSIQAFEGERVEKGQALILLEAMKMEIRLSAPQDGRISRLTVQEGQSVERDQVLVEIEAIQPET